MGVKKQNLGKGKEASKKHYCQEHDLACQAVKVDNRKMRYRCRQGCDLPRTGCVIR